MTSELIESRTATEAEIAAAAQEALEKYKAERIQSGQQVSGAREMGAVKPMTYRIPDSDAASWVLGWELDLDVDGHVYGRPCAMPRGQLGLWLQKKRAADGGPRFSVTQPARVAAMPQFPCLKQDCPKRMYTRQDMVLHVRAVHPREAELYESLLKEIMEAAAADNPRVAEIAHAVANTRERGLKSMPVEKPEQQESDLDVNLGAPVVTSLGIKKAEEPAAPAAAEAGPEIFWCRKEGCKRFFDNEPGRNAHEYKPH